MYTKITTRTVLTLATLTMAILGFATLSAQAGLLAYYPFDRDFADASGNKNDLTIATGTPTITTTAGEYVFGGGALDADSTVSTEEHLNLSSAITFGANDAWSIAFWARRRPGTDYRSGMVIGDPSNTTDFIWVPDNPSQVQGLRFRSSANTNANFGGFPDDNQFHHWVVIADGAGNVSAYRDNVSQGSVAMTSSFSITSVAGAYSATTQSMDGQIDELCIYDEALDAATVSNLYNGEGPLGTTKASNPSPDDGATDVYASVILSWTPGVHAPAVNGHIVYLSENLDDITNGIGGITQDANSYTPVQRLDFDKTYYWRVDEVNAPPDKTVFPGNIWSFTVEPVAYPLDGANITATASSSMGSSLPQKTIDGSGLNGSDLHSMNPEDMWLSDMLGPQPTWIEYQFDKVYKLHKMLVWNQNQMIEPAVGYGFQDVTVEYSVDGVAYTTLGTTHKFAQGPGAAGYASNTTIDFGGAAAKYVKLTANSNWGGILAQYGLSEVRFSYIPVNVREPNPASAATDISVNTTLSWRPGREAAKHNVYLSTDQQAVIDGTAPVVTVTSPSYATSLALGGTYYWRVDEVNDAETPAIWQGDLWSFSVEEYLVVDDFESYNDTPSGEEGSNLVYETWVDGYASPTTNGSTIGYTEAFQPSIETTTVYDGKQSVPLFYNNTAASISEVTANVADLQAGKDWTRYGIKGLTLRFFGDPNNAPQQMYVKVNGAKIMYDGDAENLQLKGWHTWYIDLASLGTNMSNVTTLTIGFERVAGIGGQGMILVDGIRLYSHERQLITPAEPGTAGSQAQYPFEGNANDSSGNGHNGTLQGNPLFVAGQIGQAITLNGAGDFVQANGPFGVPEYSATLWFRVEGGSGTRDMLSIYDDVASAFGIQISVMGTGELRFLHRFPLGNSGGSTIFSGTYDDGGWYHAAIVKSADTMTLYVNGLPAGALSDNTQFDQPLTMLTMGVLRHDNLQRFFPGLMDEVYLYNRVLSEGEIAWLAGRTKPFDKP